MRIKHRVLSPLIAGYSICPLKRGAGGELPGFLAGSERDDPLLVFDPPHFEPRVVAAKPGGFISIAALERGGKRHAVATTDFRPGFNAATSVVRLFGMDGDTGAEPTLVANAPYAHRIAVLEWHGSEYLLVSTLCAAKADRDDWTQPGGIFVAKIPADPAQTWPLRQVVWGLNKNHGFEFARLGREGRPGFLISALEGLFFAPIPDRPEDAWPTEKISPEETSDAFAFDWDGDGEPEVFSISPFHGHVLAMHKRGRDGWTKTVIHDDLAFGHIVWAGELLGRPGLLAGSRRERRELRLYRPGENGGVDPRYVLIDEGIGPSQLAVMPCGATSAALYVAAHGVNEVRLYHLDA